MQQRVCAVLVDQPPNASQAIVHFRRALRLDPRSLGAWVLMGHEFVELKNAPAAIGTPLCTTGDSFC